MEHHRALPDSEVLASLGPELMPMEDFVQQRSEGAGYWNLKNPDGSVNEEEKKTWSGLVNHILLEYNLSLVLAKKLKEVGERDGVTELRDINLIDVANGSFISDIAKARSDKERKKPGALDVDTHSSLGYEMGKQIGLPEHVSKVALTHHFPTSEEELPTWLDKIVFLADVLISQRYMTVDERMDDIESRWITNREKEGLDPLIDPEHFAKYRVLGHLIRDQVFDLLGVTDEQQFLKEIPNLREERYLRALYERNMEERGIGFAKSLQEQADKREEN